MGLINVRAQYGVIAWVRADSCQVQPILVILNRTMRCLNKINFDYLVFVKFFKLDDTHYLKVRKFMQNCTKSQLPGTFNNYFELITVVHPYDARQI